MLDCKDFDSLVGRQVVYILVINLELGHQLGEIVRVGQARGWSSRSSAEKFKICGKLSMYRIQVEDIGTYTWRTNIGSLDIFAVQSYLKYNLPYVKACKIIYIRATCIERFD